MLALCVGGVATKAYAAEDEVEDTADTKFFKGLLSNFGLSPSSAPGIDYHERSPLVVPPNINLPPPEAGGLGAVANNPAWPKDPDVKRSTAPKKKVARSRPPAEVEEEGMRPLTAAEMAPLPANKRGTPDGGAAQEGPSGARPEQLTPSQLGHEGFTFGTLFGNRNGKEVKFEKEPDRTSLTDPPVGLRTPSPKYTYGSKGKLDPTKEIGTDQAVFGVDK